VKAEGPSLLFADFEDGASRTSCRVTGRANSTKNKLGTTLNPSPLKLTPAATRDRRIVFASGPLRQERRAALALCGHRRRHAEQRSVQFKGIRFAAKGNGKKYMVVLRRGAVRDYGQFRAPFSTGKDWAEVTVKFDDLQQPTGRTPFTRLGRRGRRLLSCPTCCSATRTTISASTMSSF